MQQSDFHRNALASALALALLAPLTALAQAQDAQPPLPTEQAEQADEPAQTETDKSAKTLDAVTVTGSRIKRAEVEGPASALVVVDGLDLDGYHPFHATRADLLRRLGRSAEAAAAYDRAIELTANPAELALLTARRDALS